MGGSPQSVNATNIETLEDVQKFIFRVGDDPKPTAAEKNKQTQLKLVFLLHAIRCQKEERENTNWEVCTLPHCQIMKNVLDHFTTCYDADCNVNYCTSTRQIILHWEDCTMQDCPVCEPLKTGDKLIMKNKPQNANAPKKTIPVVFQYYYYRKIDK